MDDILQRMRARQIPPVPKDILDSFAEHRTTLVPFEERSRALADPALRTENGVREFDDGSFMISVSCKMEGVTLDMVRWWLWWFPQDPERFRAWLPEGNFNITYADEDRAYFGAESQGQFRPVTLYPYQAVGDLALMFRIDLVMPEEFGFTRKDISDAGDPLVYCARLKALKGKVLYSDFYYAIYPVEGGCLFNARFWIGRTNGNKLVRLLLLNERRMLGLAETCYKQYSCLQDILPDLYRAYH